MTKPITIKDESLRSPCCDAPVKRKVTKEHESGPLAGMVEAVFICQKDKRELEPHQLYRTDLDKTTIDNIKAAFKKPGLG